MPANLPPEYYKAEEHFRQATTLQEKIAALENLISTVPKHKGTDKIRADLRRRLSRLRDASAKSKKAGKGDLYTVGKQGAAQVCLAGFPNAGKSSLLASLTNAKPVVAEYPMSTVMPLTGMMAFEDIQFQIVDLPPLGNESTDGWVSGILRYADMLMLVTDAEDAPDAQVERLTAQLRQWNIPVCGDGSPEESAKPAIIAMNKADLPGSDSRLKVLSDTCGHAYPVVSVSAKEKSGLEILRRTVFEHSRVIRVYAKQPGKAPDMSSPFTVPSGSQVMKLAEIIHKDFVSQFRYACIWGSSRFDGQRVQKDYILHDRDVVEFHLR